MLNICHPVLLVTLTLLTGVVSSPALAQTVPPPPIPQLPDEPLPEWHVPTKRPIDVLHLVAAPDVQEAQRFRQAGLWLASIGGVTLFTGGIIYVAAASANTDLAHPNNATFDPSLEDRRNAMETAAISLLVIGGVSALAGAASFSWGQHKLREHHRKFPKDPLPPLSGY